MSKARVGRRTLDGFAEINHDAAGIDVGNAQHWVAVPSGRDTESVKMFGCFTSDLHALANWLERCGIKTVAMESTGVYWIALYEVLESRGFQVCVVMRVKPRTFQGAKRT
jgi:transposase